MQGCKGDHIQLQKEGLKMEDRWELLREKNESAKRGKSRRVTWEIRDTEKALHIFNRHTEREMRERMEYR